MNAKANNGVKKKGGCLKWLLIGLIVLVVAALVVAGVSLIGTKAALGKLKEDYTAEQPMVIERKEMNTTQRAQFKKKYTTLREIVRNGKKATIVLESDELSQLIANSPETSKVADMTDLWIEGDRLMAKMSIPMDALPQHRLPKMFRTMFRGRYLNGVFKMNLSVSNGNLHVDVEECLVKGTPVNETFLKMINSQNLDDVVSRKFGHAWRDTVESVEIKDGKMIIKTR